MFIFIVASKLQKKYNKKPHTPTQTMFPDIYIQGKYTYVVGH